MKLKTIPESILKWSSVDNLIDVKRIKWKIISVPWSKIPHPLKQLPSFTTFNSSTQMTRNHHQDQITLPMMMNDTTRRGEYWTRLFRQNQNLHRRNICMTHPPKRGWIISCPTSTQQQSTPWNKSKFHPPTNTQITHLEIQIFVNLQYVNVNQTTHSIGTSIKIYSSSTANNNWLCYESQQTKYDRKW